MTINLRYSKTDQIGKGTIITIPHSPDSTPCYQTLHRFLAMRPKSDLSAPLFIHMDKTPLSSNQFTAILKKSLTFLNIGTKQNRESTKGYSRWKVE